MKVKPTFNEDCKFRAPLKSYDINLKQKSSCAGPMCANAGRVPSGHRTVPGRCHFILNDPTKRRTGAVEFQVVP